MKLELKLTELKGFGRLHQDGFSLEMDGKNFLTYCVSLPGFLPFIHVHQGPHAGKTFIVNNADMLDALEAAFFSGSCDHACSPSDYRPGGKCDQNGCYEPNAGPAHPPKCACRACRGLAPAPPDDPTAPPMGNPAWLMENGEWAYHPELDTTAEPAPGDQLSPNKNISK